MRVKTRMRMRIREEWKSGRKRWRDNGGREEREEERKDEKEGEEKEEEEEEQPLERRKRSKTAGLIP